MYVQYKEEEMNRLKIKNQIRKVAPVNGGG